MIHTLIYTDSHLNPQVRNYKLDIRKRTFFKYSTGAEAAYAELDIVSSDLVALRKEGEKHYELAMTFEFPQVCLLLTTY